MNVVNNLRLQYAQFTYKRCFQSRLTWLDNEIDKNDSCTFSYPVPCPGYPGSCLLSILRGCFYAKHSPNKTKSGSLPFIQQEQRPNDTNVCLSSSRVIFVCVTNSASSHCLGQWGGWPPPLCVHCSGPGLPLSQHNTLSPHKTVNKQWRDPAYPPTPSKQCLMSCDMLVIIIRDLRHLYIDLTKLLQL